MAVKPPTDDQSLGNSTAQWTHDQLGASQREFLKALPLTALSGSLLLVHASAHAPERWHYVDTERAAEDAAKPKPTPQKPPEASKPTVKPSAAKPKMNDTKTWPKPPRDGKLKEGTPSRSKPANRGEKSLYDEKGGEWRYAPEDIFERIASSGKPRCLVPLCDGLG
jgi:hypothetical protein